MARHSDDPLHSLQREVERLFHDLVYQRHPRSHFSDPLWAPPADVVVSEQSARVIVELAGVPRENVKVRLLGSALEISGTREPPQEPHGMYYHRAEIVFGDFRRIVELPWEADESSVEARYRDGMLEIVLQAAPRAQHAQIRIENVSE